MQGKREVVHPPGGHSFRVLRWSKTLRDVECVTEPGKVFKVQGEGTRWHFHVAMELTLFTSGEGTRFVGDHIGTFSAGDLVMLGEKLPHYWHARGPSSGISVQWHFPEGHPFWAFPENLMLADLFKRAARGIRITGQAAASISKIMLELPRSSGTRQLSLLMAILAELASSRTHDQSLLSVQSFVLSAELHYQQAISRAVRHMVAHFREQVRLEDVLCVTAMSRATFARQFKKHSGRSFSSFLNRLRLQAACRELEMSGRSILDIALHCGFDHLSLFNRLFKRELGCTPSAYRTKSQARARRA